MFPIRDHNPSEKTPFVTYALIVANVIVFLATLNLVQGSGIETRRFLFEWALIPARISELDGFYTLVSSMFLHGGFMHIIGNMLFLWIFGDNLEEDFGHFGFAVFYLVSGLGAGLIHVLAAPGSVVPTVGASGAIAGVMGGYLLMYPKAKVDVLFIFIIIFKVIPLPAWLMLGAWFGLQIFNGAGSNPDTGGVAYWAHAGGFIVGLLLVVPLWLKRGGTRFWNRTEGHPDHPEARYELKRSSIPQVRRRKSDVPRVPRRRP
ncbi:MAG: rhomboid family intramembrane serine protease [Pseudomonadota bacterium]